MITNFFKIAIRNLWKNRGYSFLNIFGLAIGIACAGLIFLWAENELSYDGFLAKKDRLYYIMENQTYQGKVRTLGSTPWPMAQAITREVPGIAAACRVRKLESLFSLGDKAIYEKGAYTDSTFFDMIGPAFVEGNARVAMQHPRDIVITETVAHAFFGNAPATGKRLKMDNQREYQVSAVIRDFPVNSTIQLNWMIPISTYIADNQVQMNTWGMNATNTYVELAPTANSVAVGRQLLNFISTKTGKAGSAQCILFSANDWHLRADFEDGKQTGGEIRYVHLFVVIAWIILLIACINFMNLATARSEKRAREVGVRKVLGAEKRGLVGQFIGEALFLSAISVGLGLFLISLALPAFNLLTNHPVSMGLTRPVHLAAIVAVTLICGFVAGSYPALYLASFNPVFVFKGIGIKGGGASMVRKGLVVMQFSVSIVLIISTVIIYQQLQHILTRNLGYDKDNLISMAVRGNIKPHFDAIRADLIGTDVVEDAAMNSFNTMSVGNNGSGASWDGKDPSQDILISYRSVTPGFFNTTRMKLLEGRDFRADLPVADSNYAIITKGLANMMGKGGAIGKRITFNWGGSVKVIGVVADFVYGDMYGSPDPVMFYYDSSDFKTLYIRYKAGVKPDAALEKIAAVMKKDNPAYPFEYSFVDEEFDKLFTSETLVGQLSRLFACLAILISCLGLFGLSAYTAERRTKEIGIRKVLGASVSGITGLLSREFLGLVFLATLIAFPIAWLTMSHWLQQYHYRISVQWWVFVAAGLTAVAIALLTVSFQCVKAALMNPVRSLRSE